MVPQKTEQLEINEIPDITVKFNSPDLIIIKNFKICDLTVLIFLLFVWLNEANTDIHVSRYTTYPEVNDNCCREFINS